ncbi:MAG: phage tail sheath subtilisin-like domain-containing protein [Clostridium sp.]|nr:phage tail sheath subtilisin-like domain-containing protein [Clostridium sp.]
MAEYLSPGVYVEELESGSKPMEGVSTSTVGFIGLAEKGPAEGIPQLVTSPADFRRMYGGYLSENEFGDYRFLAYAVDQFFLNGGSRAFIVRVAPSDAQCAKGSSKVLDISAKNPGAWGDEITILAAPASKAKTQILEILETDAGKRYIVKNGAGFNAGDVVMFNDGEKISYNKVVRNQGNILTLQEELGEEAIDKELLPTKVLTTCEFSLDVRYGDVVEVYDNLSFNINAANYVDKKLSKSDLVTVSYIGGDQDSIVPPFEQIAGKDKAVANLVLTGGKNGSADSISAADFIGEDRGAGLRTGIQAFLDNDSVSILAAPGITDPNVQLTMVAQCENLGSRFAVLDMPRDAKKVQDLINHRDIFDSSYAAMYHPWLTAFDPLDRKNIAIPPSGSVAGIYARTDTTRGVHKAPANEVVRGCIGLDTQFNKGEQDILNPKGINLIRSFPGQGIRVWGARTATSDPSWKYVNVRRLFIFLEESIKANTNWAVFEPNDEVLWVRVQRTISVFLENLWRGGSLAGSAPEEAFFVNIGHDTMTQDDIDNGRLICVVGVAPVKPAEFVIFRLSQRTADSADAAGGEEG